MISQKSYLMVNHTLQKGDIVIYDPGYKCEIGVVSNLSVHPDSVFVIFGLGECGAHTDVKNLYKISKRFALAHKNIFDNSYAVENILEKDVYSIKW